LTSITKDVTVLIPAFNESKFIKQAIISAAKQAEYVLVSDNCSTDGTQEICKKQAKLYPNIKYFEQKENIGSIKNGEFLISNVQTKYLINMGAHDYMEDGYVNALKEAYEENKDVVLAYAPYYNVDEKNEIISENIMDKLDEQLFSDNSSERILTTITNPDHIFVIFGLFETKLVKKYWDFTRNAGSDRLLVSKFASIGKFIRVPSVRFYRRVLERDESPEAYMKRLMGEGENNYFDISYMKARQLKLLKKSHNSLSFTVDYLEKAKLFFRTRYARDYIEYTEDALNSLLQDGEKYIVYGAGTDSDYFIERMKEKILFFVDNDVRKYNQYKNGIIIKKPEEMMKYKNKVIISILGRTEEISEYLISQYDIAINRIIVLPTRKKLNKL
jgi:glycosyltransferase involved in cell wall biosynthesis